MEWNRRRLVLQTSCVTPYFFFVKWSGSLWSYDYFGQELTVQEAVYDHKTCYLTLLSLKWVKKWQKMANIARPSKPTGCCTLYSFKLLLTCTGIFPNYGLQNWSSQVQITAHLKILLELKNCSTPWELIPSKTHLELKKYKRSFSTTIFSCVSIEIEVESVKMCYVILNNCHIVITGKHVLCFNWSDTHFHRNRERIAAHLFELSCRFHLCQNARI